MQACSRYPCGMTGDGCRAPNCPLNPSPPQFAWPITIPPRHSMPVNLPVPFSGMVTIAIMDHDGNLTIKVDQPRPEQ